MPGACHSAEREKNIF